MWPTALPVQIKTQTYGVFRDGPPIGPHASPRKSHQQPQTQIDAAWIPHLAVLERGRPTTQKARPSSPAARRPPGRIRSRWSLPCQSSCQPAMTKTGATCHLRPSTGQITHRTRSIVTACPSVAPLCEQFLEDRPPPPTSITPVACYNRTTTAMPPGEGNEQP